MNTWSIERAEEGDPRLAGLLTDGYEPFGVTVESGVCERKGEPWTATVYHLKKQEDVTRTTRTVHVGADHFLRAHFEDKT